MPEVARNMTMMTQFRCVVADPPWRYNDNGCQGAAEKEYPTMRLEDIAALPVASVIAEQAHLWLWITTPFLVGPEREKLFGIVDAWGFEPKGLLTWGKLNPSGVGVFYGIGRWLRSATEHVILGVHGNLPLNHAPHSLYLSPVNGHSKKPSDFHRIVERSSPGPRLELFARSQRKGWTCLGNELDGRDIGDALRSIR